MDADEVPPAGWQKSRVGELGTWFNGSTPSKSRPEYWNGGSIPWVTPKDLKTPRLDDSESHITNLALQDGMRVVPAGTLLMVVRGMILSRSFPVALTRRAMTFNQDMKALQPKEGHDSEFLLYWFQTNEARVLGLVEESSHGTKKLSTELLYSLSMRVPAYEDQRKISRSLGSVEEVIDHSKAVLGQLIRLKAALLDQLLLRGAPRGTTKLESYRLGELFEERKERGIPGLPILSVTMNDGLVNRDSLGRRVVSELAPEQHLLVRKGDIAYNMMRMWQGVFGLAHYDGFVSPAYVVLKPEPDIDPHFASYLFRHPATIRKFERYSQGLTGDRLRLYFDQFARIPVEIPNLDAQRTIAETLRAVDDHIQTEEDYLGGLTEFKAALSQELLTEHVLVPCNVEEEP